MRTRTSLPSTTSCSTGIRPTVRRPQGAAQGAQFESRGLCGPKAGLGGEPCSLRHSQWDGEVGIRRLPRPPCRWRATPVKRPVRGVPGGRSATRRDRHRPGDLPDGHGQHGMDAGHVVTAPAILHGEDHSPGQFESRVHGPRGLCRLYRVASGQGLEDALHCWDEHGAGRQTESQPARPERAARRTARCTGERSVLMP